MKRGLISERGLTIIEIMVVIIIIGVVMATLGRRVFGAGDKAKANLTKTQLQGLKSYIETYQLQYNKLPASLNDLVNCSSETTGANCVPLISDEEDLQDAWGTPFAYSQSGREYTITSLGANRAQGGSGVDADFDLKGP